MPCDPASAPPSILPPVSMLSAVSSYLMLFLATKPLLLLLSLLDNFVQPSYILQNSVPASCQGCCCPWLVGRLSLCPLPLFCAQHVVSV